MAEDAVVPGGAGRRPGGGKDEAGMKILLTTLNAKYIHSNLALKYLYAAGEAQKDSIEIQEFTINNDDDYIFGELLRSGCGLMCFSCYVWNIERTLYLAESLKKACPRVALAFGGPEVSFDTLEFITNNKFVDFVMVGEGEAIFAELAAAVQEEAPDLSRIRGLVYRQQGKIYVNGPAAPLRFDSVPFPYLHLVSEPDKIMYYESARGCPYSCSYCLSALDKRARSLPLERVKEDLSYFIYKKVKQVKFVDRTFNYDRQRCAAIMEYLMDRDNGVTNYHFEMCGELFDEKLLALSAAARPGLFQYEIGVQSTNPATLDAIRRKGDFPRLAANVRQLREAGNITLHLDLIAGLPFEDYNTFRKSFNDVYGLRPHVLQLGFLKLLRGAPIREQAAEFGYEFRSRAPYEVIFNRSISAGELGRLKMVEKALDLYYNRGGFRRALEYATGEAESPFGFYEEFARFYYGRGYQHASHKKEDQYRILAAYGRWKSRQQPGWETGLRECMEADLEENTDPETLKKFLSKGWELQYGHETIG